MSTVGKEITVQGVGLFRTSEVGTDPPPLTQQPDSTPIQCHACSSVERYTVV